MKKRYRIFFKRMILIITSGLILIGGGCIMSAQSDLQQESVTFLQSRPSAYAVAVFANEAAIAAYTYSYATYKQRLIDLHYKYFTTRGFAEYQRALLASNNLLAVEQKKFVVSATATDSPLIMKEGYINNIYTWEVQVPLLVTYQNNTEKIHQHLIVNLKIQHVPKEVNVRGLAVNQLVSRVK